MAVRIIDEQRPLNFAALDRIGAARVKVAAGRRRDRAWDVAFQELALRRARGRGSGIAESSARV